MFLSAPDVRKLTGKVYPKCQAAWLRSRGISCVLNAANECVVLTSEVERMLGCPTTLEPPPVDFDAIDQVDAA